MARFFMSAICSNSVLGRVKLSRTTLTFFSLAGLAAGLVAAFTALGAAAGWVLGVDLVAGRFFAAAFEGVCAMVCMP